MKYIISYRGKFHKEFTFDNDLPISTIWSLFQVQNLLLLGLHGAKKLESKHHTKYQDKEIKNVAIIYISGNLWSQWFKIPCRMCYKI